MSLYINIVLNNVSLLYCLDLDVDSHMSAHVQLKSDNLCFPLKKKSLRCPKTLLINFIDTTYSTFA